MFEHTRHRAILVFLGTALFTLSCGGEAENQPAPASQAEESTSEEAPGFRDISVDQLHDMLTNGDPFLVNVHIPFEGNIPGTDVSIPFDEVAEHLDQLPESRDSRIVLYCRSGRMSEEAATTLASLGYTNVFNLAGGFRAWEGAGYELETGGTG
jgi:rhodanese-related sulfurtransferase